ncbi:uncharacterized protein LOC126583093 [Malus sylvestris]|uniref:uncharacterized protein LOC126583093 n=1 Tax=Malus sylvestris TaxID=3752 RepID=UPI0021AC16F0|nr:uncharacterized protein LOC126583093 [Malus sylvestris]XP_050103346.1 uncharacterized protein LOC126583093 [Malus sylvestris]
MDIEVAHWFVLNNCDETITYLDEHEELMKREHHSHLYAKKHCELFPRWFCKNVKKLKEMNSPTYTEELYNLVIGPLSAELYSGCHVNGIKFLATDHDDKLCTQNSGVHVSGGGDIADIDFYEKLTSVGQLFYKDRCQVILFKCRWFDTNPRRVGGVKRDDGLLSVNTNRCWYNDDPYILAIMAKQIFYIDDPNDRRGWKVVQKIKHRDPASNDDYVDVANQQLEASTTLGTDTLRDMTIVQELYQVAGGPIIEIPINSIMIDLGDLPLYNAPEHVNNNVDMATNEEEWESKYDNNDDLYSTLDED